MTNLVLIDGPYGLGKYPGDDIYTSESEALYRGVLGKAERDGDHVIIFGLFTSLAWIQTLVPDGLVFRGDVVWHTPDYTGGGTKTWAPRHEMFLHYAKAAAPFNADAIRVPYGDRAKSGVAKKTGRTNGWTPHPLGARCPNVVTFTSDRLATKLHGRTAPNKHACVKPKALLRMIVLACSSEGGSVMEPFVGSDNLREVCGELGRQWRGRSDAREFALDRIPLHAAPAPTPEQEKE